MNKVIVGIVAGLVVGAAATWWALRSEAPEPKPAEPAEAPVRAGALQLDAARRQAAGISVATPRPAKLPAEIRAFGRVLDPTPYVTLVAEKAVAEAAAKASQKELERVRKLFAAEGNASAQAVEAAEAAAMRDQAAAESARVRLLAGWGQALAAADLDKVRDALVAGAAILRIDLLPGDAVTGTPEKAQVSLPGGREAYGVQVLGPAPVADPQVQGACYLALLTGHSLPSGAALDVTLVRDGAAEAALLVPRAAVVYHEGSAWIYVRQNDAFARRRVEIGRSVGNDVVVTTGLAAADEVAVTGAQQLLSMELVTGTAPSER